MVEVLGVPPQHLLTDAPKVSKYFDRRPDGTFVPKQQECRQVADIVNLCVVAVGDACTDYSVSYIHQTGSLSTVQYTVSLSVCLSVSAAGPA